MGRPRTILVALVLGLLTACQSRRSPPPTEAEVASKAIAEAFTRSRQTTRHGDGWMTVSLVDDAQLVARCQALLLGYAKHESASVRIDVAPHLAYFGTKTALNGALALAKTDEDDRLRRAGLGPYHRPP